VGAHLADQLLIPMGLAGGGVFRTLAISHHTEPNMRLIEQFVPVKFTVEGKGAEGYDVRVSS
jgi:RNA 3'-terminal phosphate cyclase (ATP)